ncbi:MAG TPA: TIGR03619 family F420-dependent LLM class oxidoreductase [Gammaproteobacteria bacterium]|nr:TIGR03619 family F420-dependent LLM class oxidoreductase [Gammaproteobacteria bacterium]
MDIGIFNIVPDGTCDLAVIAKRAEELGFESFWVGDHPVFPVVNTLPYPGMEHGTPPPEFVDRIPDPFITLARASAATTSIKFGTSICLVAQRNPLVLANEIATLDALSGGRFVFGIGAGWSREECEILGGDFDHRWTQIREQIGIMKGLWTKDQSEHHGRYYDFPAVKGFPKPKQQPHPPILLGAFPSDRIFKRIAEFGDGWLPLVYTPEDLAANVEQLKQVCDQKGRDFSTIDITVLGGPEQWRTADELAALEAAGATRVILWMLAPHTDGVLAEVETLAGELL